MNGRKMGTPGTLGSERLARLAVSAAFLALTACHSGDQPDELESPQSVPEMAEAQDGALKAETDVAEARAGYTVAVGILGNDNVTAGTSMQLVGSPENGSAVLLPSGQVEYTANEGFEGTDIVDYLLVDADGNESYGKLYIAVVCADCSPNLATTNSSGQPYCFAENPDPDGDGYGWENNASCVVPEPGAALSPLSAIADTVDLKAGDVRTVTPLRNDSIANRDSVVMTIESEPTEGRIEAVEAGIFVYAAPDSYTGSDSLLYSITDTNGDVSMASVDFNIICDSCIDYKGLRLSWPANPEEEGVDGYKVLFGSDENPLTSTVISDVRVSDGESPFVEFDLAEDLNLASNEGGCFMIQAYRGSETSEVSEAACFTRGS